MQIIQKPVAEILLTHSLKASPFQRPYAWADDNIEQLLDDIASNIGREKHFIGTIVTGAQEDGRFHQRVIDGQQRLATVLIMLAAARDRFVGMGDQDSAGALTPYISSMSLATRVRSPKLEMNSQDNEFFRARVIDGRAEIAPKYQSHKRLAGACAIVRAALDEMDGPKLGEWTDFIQNRLKAIHLEVGDEVNACATFEALNDGRARKFPQPGSMWIQH